MKARQGPPYARLRAASISTTAKLRERVSGRSWMASRQINIGPPRTGRRYRKSVCQEMPDRARRGKFLCPGCHTID